MTAYNVNNSNLFAYCGNNPVMRIDNNGEIFANIIAGAVVGGVVSFVLEVATQVIFEGKTLTIGQPRSVDWDLAIVTGVSGAVTGALFAGGIAVTPGAQALVNGATTFVLSAEKNSRAYNRGEITMGQAVVGTLVSTATSAAFGYVGASGKPNVIVPHRSSVPRGNSRVIITAVNALRTAGENFVGWLGGTTTAGITKCVSDSFRYSRLK